MVLAGSGVGRPGLLMFLNHSVSTTDNAIVSIGQFWGTEYCEMGVKGKTITPVGEPCATGAALR